MQLLKAIKQMERRKLKKINANKSTVPVISEKLVELGETVQQIKKVADSFAPKFDALNSMYAKALGELPDIEKKLRAEIREETLKVEETVSAPNGWKAVWCKGSSYLEYDNEKLLLLVQELVGDDETKLAKLHLCLKDVERKPYVRITSK